MQIEPSEQERIVEAAVHRGFGELAATLRPDAPHAAAHAAIEATLAALGLLVPPDGGAGDDPLASLRVARIVAVEAGRAALPYPLLDRLVVANIAARSSALRRLLQGAGTAHVAVAAANAAPEQCLRFNDGALHGTASLVTFPDDARRVIATVNDTSAVEPRSVLAVLDPRDARASRSTRTSVEPGCPAADLAADGVDFDPRQFVTTLDDGSDAAATCELAASLLAAAEIAGAASAALDLTAAHLGTRTQFGRPLGTQQALRHLMADNHVRVEAMSAAVSYATLALEARAEDAQASVRSAKHYASVAGKALAEDALQMHGAIGFTAEYGLARLLRRILRLGAMHGAPRAQEARLYAILADDGIPR